MWVAEQEAGKQTADLMASIEEPEDKANLEKQYLPLIL